MHIKFFWNHFNFKWHARRQASALRCVCCCVSGDCAGVFMKFCYHFCKAFDSMFYWWLEIDYVPSGHFWLLVTTHIDFLWNYLSLTCFFKTPILHWCFFRFWVLVYSHDQITFLIALNPLGIQPFLFLTLWKLEYKHLYTIDQDLQTLQL